MWKQIGADLNKLFSKKAYWFILLGMNIFSFILNFTVKFNIVGFILTCIGIICCVSYLLFFIDWRKK